MSNSARSSRALALGLAALGLLGVSSARAGEPSLKITASDAVAVDFFGGSVALSADRMLIGAPLDDHSLQGNAGSAYLYELGTGDELVRIDSGPFSTGDNFGASVALDPDFAIVGAPFEIDRGAPGAAFLFDAVSGGLLFELGADDAEPGDHFGVSVDVDDLYAVVGAWADDDNGGQSGAAYLFSTADGSQIHKLLPDDGVDGDRFGISVAVSGDLILVGAHLHDGAASNSGAAYVFDAVTGNQLHKFVPNDAASGDNFGISVALDGDVALIGALFDDDLGVSSGSAYLFDASTGAELHKLVPADGAAGDWFGISVGLSADRAVVGAERKDGLGNESGAAYVFDALGGGEITKLEAIDGTHFDRFGTSVAAHGERLLVGAYGVAPMIGGGSSAGAAYRFDLDGGPWRDHGFALAGVAGDPVLSAVGDLQPSSPLTVSVSNAAASAQLYMVLGVDYIAEPLKGGVLLPSADIIKANFSTNAGGALTLPTTWPAGLPSCFTFFLQFWVVDAAGPNGYAATNAISGTTP